jgi:hypothetical protein
VLSPLVLIAETGPVAERVRVREIDNDGPGAMRTWRFPAQFGMMIFIAADACLAKERMSHDAAPYD